MFRGMSDCSITIAPMACGQGYIQGYVRLQCHKSNCHEWFMLRLRCSTRNWSKQKLTDEANNAVELCLSGISTCILQIFAWSVTTNWNISHQVHRPFLICFRVVMLAPLLYAEYSQQFFTKEFTPQSVGCRQFSSENLICVYTECSWVAFWSSWS